MRENPPPMVADVRIRPATRADAPALMRLIRALAVYERLEDQVHATEELLAEHLFGERPAAEALLAELDGEPIGYALWFTTFSTFLARPGIWLEDVFVLPDRRRAGLGRALLARVAAIAVERDAGRLEWSALDWNEPALAFYRSLGAEPLREWIIHRLSGPELQRLAAG
jgi:GNAT superfamily N-acetyltransferase